MTRQAAPRNAPCPLRARLLELWRKERDERALERLLRCVPAEIPADVWIEVRNEMIVGTAIWLGTEISGATRNILALLLAHAGERIMRPEPQPLAGQIYKRLASEDRAELGDRLRAIAALRPNHCAAKWPGERQLNSILEAGNLS